MGDADQNSINSTLTTSAEKRGEVERVSPTCRIVWVASKALKHFAVVSVVQILRATYETPPKFARFIKKTCININITDKN